ncbi:hypothetical protein M514_07770 [Trichuris suis]|uniref:Uncharacterized protein n=1 Tax=Trichuris suis TaxID=68888 RepID=A0A085M2B9_9BILA|nr:hypothetical protein M513_07770 [Trichuris suis]KFD59912.1 hypothetical protein M514_07770 [Trichuris suis]
MACAVRHLRLDEISSSVITSGGICGCGRPTATRFVPLSEYTTAGVPRRLMKRRKAIRNESMSSEKDTSRWTALVAKHVNIQP